MAAAGPIMAAATAKMNAKKGIANVIMGGEDYNWVCPCKPLAGVPLDPKYEAPKQDASGASATTKDVCPHDVNLGCASWVTS